MARDSFEPAARQVLAALMQRELHDARAVR